MIDKLNTYGLPARYDYLIGEDESLVGIEYIGKKSDIVVPAVCTEATVFKSLGKLCIVYKESGNDTYTLMNRKGSIKLEKIHDFIAGPTFLYVQMQGEFNKDNLEWYVLNKDFESIKNIGTFSLNDVSTRGGARVLSGTRTNLEILDRHGKTCRITLKDASIDEVITFGSKLKGEESVKKESSTYRFEFNLTTGKVKMTGDTGDDIRINKFSNLDKAKSVIVNLMDSELVEDEITEQVRRHVETYKVAYVGGVEADRAKKIAKLLGRFEENADFLVIALLIETFTTDGLIEKIKSDFVDVATISGKDVLRGKRTYAVCCINMEIILITLVLERVSGKLIYDICDKDNTTIWNVTNNDVKVSNLQCQIEEYPKDMDKNIIKLPLDISKNKDSYGNTIENERFENIIYVDTILSLIDKDDSLINTRIALIIFDGFVYDIKKIKARKKAEDMSKQEIHSKKYNTESIVLSTRTSHSTVMSCLDTLEHDMSEVTEEIV